MVCFRLFEQLGFKLNLASVVCEKFMICSWFFTKSCRSLGLPEPQYVCSELAGIHRIYDCVSCWLGCGAEMNGLTDLLLPMPRPAEVINWSAFSVPPSVIF